MPGEAQICSAEQDPDRSRARQIPMGTALRDVCGFRARFRDSDRFAEDDAAEERGPPSSELLRSTTSAPLPHFFPFTSLLQSQPDCWKHYSDDPLSYSCPATCHTPARREQ